MKTNFLPSIAILSLSLLLGGNTSTAYAQETAVIDYTAPSYWQGKGASPLGDAGADIYTVGAVPLTVTPAKRKLARIGYVVGTADLSGNPNFGHLDTMEWRVAVWSSQAAFFADPLHGDVGSGGFEVQFNHPTNPDYMNPIAGGQIQLFEGSNAYYVEADVRAANIILTPGHQYWVALLAIVNPFVDGWVVGGLVELPEGNPAEPWLVNTVGYPSPAPFGSVPWVGPDGETRIGMRNAQAAKVTVMPHTKPHHQHQSSAAIKLLPCIPGVSC